MNKTRKHLEKSAEIVAHVQQNHPELWEKSLELGEVLLRKSEEVTKREGGYTPYTVVTAFMLAGISYLEAMEEEGY